MNLRAVHDEVARLLPPDQTFSVLVEVWNHRSCGGPVTVEVSIWDGEKHYSGTTIEEALRRLSASRQSQAGGHVVAGPAAIPSTELVLPESHD